MEDTLKWYLVIRRMNRPYDEWKDKLTEHLSWLRGQHERSDIVISGPNNDRSLGLYLMRATSEQQARHIAESDPFAQGDLATIDITEWQIHQMFGIGSFDPAGLVATHVDPGPR